MMYDRKLKAANSHKGAAAKTGLLIERAKRANERAGSIPMKRRAIRIIEDLLSAGMIADAAAVAKKHGLDKDGMADEAIKRAAQIIGTEAFFECDPRIIEFIKFVAREAGVEEIHSNRYDYGVGWKRTRFVIEAQRAIYGHSALGKMENWFWQRYMAVSGLSGSIIDDRYVSELEIWENRRDENFHEPR